MHAETDAKCYLKVDLFKQKTDNKMINMNKVTDKNVEYARKEVERGVMEIKG